jgi:hypothetical protein
MKVIITAIAVVVVCISTPASAMNSWDWANMFRALADFNNSLKPAAPAVVIVAPAVVAPIPVTGTWVGGSPPYNATTGADEQQQYYRGIAPVGAAVSDDVVAADCEDKPYIQYKDELKVFGDKAAFEQLCQIKSQASLSCDRELIKITLVLKAADISVEGCAEPSNLPLLETGW